VRRRVSRMSVSTISGISSSRGSAEQGFQAHSLNSSQATATRRRTGSTPTRFLKRRLASESSSTRRFKGAEPVKAVSRRSPRVPPNPLTACKCRADDRVRTGDPQLGKRRQPGISRKRWAVSRGGKLLLLPRRAPRFPAGSRLYLPMTCQRGPSHPASPPALPHPCGRG
jgi:hypothetical protein